MAHRFARDERNVLAQELLTAGPDAPTLCDGWKTRDLAAHLVLRERKLIAAAGIQLKTFAAVNRRVMSELAAGDYAELVAKFRVPAAFSPLRIDAVDEAMNFAEYFIHTEDVRRGTPGWKPRDLPEDYVAALYTNVRRSVKFRSGRFPTAMRIESPGREPIGTDTEAVRIAGAPGELLLFFAGRGKAADVDISGPDALVAQWRGANLGI